MSILSVETQPLVPRNRPYPPGVGSAPDAVRRQGGHAAQELSQALDNVQARLNLIDATLRQQSPVVNKIVVVDSQGKVLAALGDFIFAGVPATNYFSEIHAGDPLNTGDPSQALFNANTDGSVTIGQHGWLQVLDPYEADAAWIGTQFDTLPVTGAANNGVGLIRLTVVGHTLATGDVVQVRGVIGVTSATNGTSNANGTFTITKIAANTFDLQASVFVGTYTSGGTVDRLMHVTGAANNGGGLIRLTVTAHSYESGDKVNVQTVGGVPNATGQWIVTVITANTFDLVGSTFAGAYTSGGTSLRYFAGGLFQTIAIGDSFADYKLRAFADGSLKIQDATITLSGTGGTIVLDPDTGSITVTDAGGGDQVVIQSGNITLQTVDSGGAVLTAESASLIEPGRYTAYAVGLTSEALSEAIAVNGYTGATAFGPLLGLHQFRGAPGSETATQSGDTLGGMVAWGYDGSGESQYAAGILSTASEAHALTAHGARWVFEVTPNGTTTPVTGMTLGQDKVLNVVGGYKINGTAGGSVTIVTAKLTGGGTNGSMTFVSGLLTGQTAAT